LRGEDPTRVVFVLVTSGGIIIQICSGGNKTSLPGMGRENAVRG